MPSCAIFSPQMAVYTIWCLDAARCGRSYGASQRSVTGVMSDRLSALIKNGVNGGMLVIVLASATALSASMSANDRTGRCAIPLMNAASFVTHRCAWRMMFSAATEAMPRVSFGSASTMSLNSLTNLSDSPASPTCAMQTGK